MPILSNAYRYLNLIVLPHPPFTVPPSSFDPIHRAYAYKERGDPVIEASRDRIPNTSFAQSVASTKLGTLKTSVQRQDPKKEVIGMALTPAPGKDRIYAVNLDPEAPKRNTIAFPCLGDERRPKTLVRLSKPTTTQSQLTETLHPFLNGLASASESTPTKAVGGPRVRIIESKNTTEKRLWDDIVASYDGAPIQSERSPNNLQNNKKNPRRHSDESLPSPSRKLPEKRASAPPVLSFSWENHDENPLHHLIPQKLPLLHEMDHQRQRQPLGNVGNPSFPARLYELDLSPIIEDANIFSTPDLVSTVAPTRHEMASEHETMDPLESSDSSYGEVLHESAFDYFAHVDTDDSAAWREGNWFNPQKSHKPKTPSTHNYMHGKTNPKTLYSDVPEVILTAPTPELNHGPAFQPWIDRLEEPSVQSWDEHQRNQLGIPLTVSIPPTAINSYYSNGSHEKDYIYGFNDHDIDHSHRPIEIGHGDSLTLRPNSVVSSGSGSLMRYLDNTTSPSGQPIATLSADQSVQDPQINDLAINTYPETRTFSRIARSLLRPVSWIAGKRNRLSLSRSGSHRKTDSTKPRRHTWNLSIFPRSGSQELATSAPDLNVGTNIDTEGISKTFLTEKTRRRHSAFSPTGWSEMTEERGLSQSKTPSKVEFSKRMSLGVFGKSQG